MTGGQRQVLAALTAEYAANGGWPVPVRRLGELAGRSSSATLAWHLAKLKAAGLVELSPYRQGFRPTRPP